MKISSIQANIKKQGYLLLDGGLATELESRNIILDTPLWSAQLLQTQPQVIKDIHKTYLEAGADCIITASYQASFKGFYDQGIFRPEAEVLINRSVSLAMEARDEYMESEKVIKEFNPLVAASIGPYGAFLANGAEYHGSYNVSRDQLRAFHEDRWSILSESGADLFACETIPSFEEILVLSELLKEYPDTIAWMSFSCKDGRHIGDGTPISECAALLKENKNVLAVGVNCTAPRYVSSLIREILAAAPEMLVVVYPNSGEIYDGKSRRWEGTVDSETFGEAAGKWFFDGAKLIGGCCRTGPKHIKMIRKKLLNIL